MKRKNISVKGITHLKREKEDWGIRGKFWKRERE
jgi:hypothetical protein